MTERSKQLKPNLYLVGFMGTGKSAVGRSVANRLGFAFIDSDHAIEEADGRSIKEIFDSEGEVAFRELERKFIDEGHANECCVISCGGGLVAQPGMLKRLRAKGPVVCLLASPETIFERVKGNEKRPLLNVQDPLARIRELLGEREPIYKKAGTEVLTDGRTISDVASHVCRVYRLDARSWK
ncbi:MAG: shikimate kinase [Opitutaceae bacterium]|nr:shikimate kinase [Opitutaceae bacterium]